MESTASITDGGQPTRLAAGLLALDVVGFIVIFNLVHQFELEKWPGIFSVPLLGVLAFQLLVLYVLDLYALDERFSGMEVMFRTITAVVTTGVILAGFVYITKARETEQLFFRGVFAAGLSIFLFWTLITRYYAIIWVRRLAQKVRWLVVMDVAPDSPMRFDIEAVNRTGKTTVLVPDMEKADCFPQTTRGNIAGTFDAFEEFAQRSWSGVIIATEGALPDTVLRHIMDMRLSGVRIYDLTDFYEEFMQKVPILHLQDNWFALSHGFDLLHHNIQMRIKRVLDIVLSMVLLIVAAPVMLFAAIAIKVDRKGDSKGPIIYKQLRTGINGVEFYIYKFRTMVKNAETKGPQWASKDDARVTKVGRFLRRTRVDELPQLWNVLKGEMSFIGPRPERPDFNRQLEQAIPYYDLRHLIKPGISGWAQVKYNYGSSTEEALEKLQYDIYYIKNYSLLLDLFIVLKTIRVILGQRGR